MHRLLPALPVALLLGGCSFAFSAGAEAVPADEVATQAEDSLEEQVGTRPDITCPDDLPAEVGAELRCTLTVADDPAEYGVTVTVTSVEGDTAEFDVLVDDQPSG